ncbi:MAG: hypothetical protein ACF8XB_11565 [Planctomycetota bacterium JB042]
MRSRPMVLAALFALAGVGEAPAQERIELKPRSYRQFDLTLPAERFLPVGDGIPVPHAGGDRFAARLDGTALLLDADGDGTAETRVAGEETAGVRTAFTRLTGTSPDGNPLRYAIRLRDAGAGWEWAASGAVTGKIGTTRISILDQNGNGRFSDVGEDAMIVGKSAVASFLSDVVSIGGVLHRLKVDRDGAAMEVTP